MCKPGSASGGGVTSSGLGVAFAVVGIAGVPAPEEAEARLLPEGAWM